MRPLPLLLVLLLPTVLLAGDEPALRSFEEAVQKLPAPGDAQAFDVEGRVEIDGEAVGTFRLAAHVDPQAEPARWSLVEERRTTFEDGTLELAARAITDRALQPLGGELAEVDAFGDRLVHAWTKVEDTYRVETRSESRQAMSRSAASEAPCLTTLAALVLFARLVPAEPAAWETRLFAPDWEYLEAERPFVATHLVLTRATGAPGAAPWALSAVQERARVDLVLDGATRDLVRVTIRQKDRPTLVLLPHRSADRTDGPPPDADDLFTSPSTTPRGLAARVALAFATVDADAFAAVVHWPSLREAMKGRIRGEVSDETFRASILDQFRRQGAGREPQPAAEARAFIEQEAPSFAVTSEGEDAAVVALSPAWGAMRLTLRRIDGAWYLARLPGT